MGCLDEKVYTAELSSSYPCSKNPLRGIVFYNIEQLRGKEISVFDTTLRDGEQTPGVSLTPEEKLVIARQLDKLGVDIIEAGFPVSSRGEFESVRSIAGEGLEVTVCGLARIMPRDISACLDAGVGMVHVFVSTSDIQIAHTIKKGKEQIVEEAVAAVDMVKQHGVPCLFSAMDATRTSPDFLRQIFLAVQQAGADTVNVPDTVGVMAPSVFYGLVGEVCSYMKVPVDVHCHNDFGLAVANSLAAVEAGAREVQVTVNGLGERAGNANLAETVMSLHSIYGARTNIRTEFLVETARLVERLTEARIPITAPIVGENAFSHESGIHSHGVIERSDTFEPGIMTPEMVGHKRRIVLGKHTGRHAVKQVLDLAGYFPSEEQLGEILQRIKDLGDKGKQVTDADLQTIAEVVLGEVDRGHQALVLKEVSVMTGNIITPTATVRALVRGEERVVANIGVGPVDAAVKAVRGLLGQDSLMRVRDFRIEAITGGSDALAEVIIAMEDEAGRKVSARSAREDIVMASVEALVSAINRLILLEEREAR
ncbi:MAG: 2-isopropylmalate synthase [Methanosaeta sp. PtaB.Bin039]|nr:MAG: 2-isopropylmalate synthase [Methanosaeta sp. PtaB.Bin039]OPY47173.1 MAG: 2-isopropylmalate synthase [Methanosaeta sp. PtaU1.Bin028]HOT06841.1 2-isopropylmalate synthase [Methanotrichaceae archaeon]HQF16737.1 2-isopropylmalate synthase [Methanotrichaceae archaeon]HQI91369.1 2-isopropylmalate synthase [Methanotrichaceae archaeon]